MKACITLHSMIIEDERKYTGILNFDYEQLDDSPLELPCNHTSALMEYIQHYHQIKNTSTHS